MTRLSASVNQKPRGAYFDEDLEHGASKPQEPDRGKHTPKSTWVDDKIPKALKNSCHRTYGDSDATFVREQYGEAYPNVNQAGEETEHARSSKRHGHSDLDNFDPAHQNGVVQPNVKLDMTMRLSLEPASNKMAADEREDSSHQRDDNNKNNNNNNNNIQAITGGLGYGLVSWPPKRKPNSHEYRYTKGDEWQQAGDTCAAKRLCGSSGHQNSGTSVPGPSSTQSQINSKFH